jgi:hypothetical protein
MNSSEKNCTVSVHPVWKNLAITSPGNQAEASKPGAELNAGKVGQGDRTGFDWKILDIA